MQLEICNTEMAYANYSSPSKSDVLRELVDNFARILDIGTIKDVAKQNEYDVHKSTNALLQLSAFNNNTMPSGNHFKKPTNRFSPSKQSRIPNSQNYLSTFAIEQTIDDILKGDKILVILRGLPGSGKSFLAKAILEVSLRSFTHQDHIFSADDFFSRSGRYIYDVSKLDEAHKWTRRRVFEKMLQGYSPLIIDNTNTRMWEMQPYAQMAAQCGYKISILEVNTKWSFDCRELTRRNKHGVPKPKIILMLDRYEKHITPELLLSRYNLPVEYQRHPQERSYPPIIRTTQTVSANTNRAVGLSGNQLQPQQRSYPPNIRTIQTVSANTESAVGLSGIHNHNFMNQDLKLPSLPRDVDGETSRGTDWRNEVPKLIELSSDDEDDSNSKVKTPTRDHPVAKFPPENFDFDAWGVDEKVVRNWDIVTQIEDDSEGCFVDLTVTEDPTEKPVTCESDCNTYLADFHVEPEGAIVLYGRDRDINSFDRKLPTIKSGMLDKSCSTQDDVSSDRNGDLKKLADVFQNIPPLCIRDMYDDCKGDFDLTFEIFLKDTTDYSCVSFTKENIIYDSETDRPSPKKYKFTHNEQLGNIPDAEELIPDSIPEIPGRSQTQEPFEIPFNSLPKPIQPSSFHNTPPPQRNDLVSSSSELPSTSQSTPKAKKASQPEVNDDFVMVDSDSDLEFENCKSPSESETRSEDNDFIELNLGNAMIEQLEKEFEDPGNDYPKGFLPVVQVPKTFARQLYAFYVESVYQQMEVQKSVLEKLEKEDEAFARKLFEEENGLVKPPKPEGLQEIMNEQVAMNIYERDISQWKDCTPDNFALHLTKKKLIDSFPTIDRDVLLEIFNANREDYKQTVEDLLISVDASEVRSITNVTELPISEAVVQELKKANEDYGAAEDVQDDNRSYQSFRDEGNAYLNKRTQLYQKAQEYYSQGQREVAQFYSQLAQRQTQFYDMANHKAATILLEEHSQRLQNFDTLDLHFLFVKEAIPALDVFIDRNINLLKGGTKASQNLLIITGRGNRSMNGISRIKPAVISRLKGRQIQFVHMNPGLLKIKVNRNSTLTSDL